jgi:enoyl-CoA hydratase/carnithine racemase
VARWTRRSFGGTKRSSGRCPAGGTRIQEEKTVSTEKTILLERENGVAQLILNRPDKLNAMNRQMYLEMGQAFDVLEQDPDFRVLIITGAGRAFCAGGDISELAEATADIEAAQQRLNLSHSVVVRLRRIKQPIIVAINGDAIGGGCTIALNGDIRIAAENARIGTTFIRVGLALDMGGTYYLPRLVGISKACELALLGDMIGAREAERIGLVNRVVALEDLDNVVHEMATRLAQSPALTLGLIKNGLYKCLNKDFDASLADEINVQSICMNSAEARQRLKAFLEKRKSS